MSKFETPKAALSQVKLRGTAKAEGGSVAASQKDDAKSDKKSDVRRKLQLKN